mmetsp:Transcript_15388/g.53446  ORF Transcript_15388/g.53446 Transcript_15388/m.53446 type:complete len:204 (+) Transcript_15388:378-989(+)
MPALSGDAASAAPPAHGRDLMPTKLEMAVRHAASTAITEPGSASHSRCSRRSSRLASSLGMSGPHAVLSCERNVEGFASCGSHCLYSAWTKASQRGHAICCAAITSGPCVMGRNLMHRPSPRWSAADVVRFTALRRSRNHGVRAALVYAATAVSRRCSMRMAIWRFCTSCGYETLRPRSTITTVWAPPRARDSLRRGDHPQSL